MKPFIDEERLARMNAELKRALAAGDADILAGRFSPPRLKAKTTANPDAGDRKPITA